MGFQRLGKVSKTVVSRAIAISKAAATARADEEKGRGVATPAVVASDKPSPGDRPVLRNSKSSWKLGIDRRDGDETPHLAGHGPARTSRRSMLRVINGGRREAFREGTECPPASIRSSGSDTAREYLVVVSG